jgi:hypothetical protein
MLMPLSVEASKQQYSSYEGELAAHAASSVFDEYHSTNGCLLTRS